MGDNSRRIKKNLTMLIKEISSNRKYNRMKRLYIRIGFITIL